MSTTVNMLGRGDYQPLGRRGLMLRVPFGKMAWVTVSLPLVGFIFCIVWSILFNFDKATSTHCGVQNILPSISSAIGNFTPQRYIWRAAIALHACPRLLVAAMYYRYYLAILYAWSHFLARIACWLNVVENLALIGLTFVSSAENYSIHEKCFVTFMITSEVYMLLTCYLLKSTRTSPPSNIEARSLKLKWKLVAVNVTCFALAGYFFLRHNWYCETFVYSLFAFFEYVVVLTNMGFHMTAYWDFHDRELMVGISGIRFS